jgi:alkylation response protein AidB-like acyl-CoA dehydrogenase
MSAGTRLESRPVGSPPTAVQAASGLEEAAAALAPTAARYADEADATHSLASEVVDGLRAAGFARHFAPAPFGGVEGSFGEVTRAVLTLGEVCAATAWVASLSAYSSRFAAHLPSDGHAELWGGPSGADAFVVAGLVPTGAAQPVSGGGYRLTGTWLYVSGVEFADWALLCAPVAEEAPTPDSAPELRFFALPRGAFEIDPTWDSVGMRATGSHSVVVAGAFVPSHLSFPRAHMITGANEASAALCHTVPFQAVGGLTFGAPAVGAASGALKAALAALGTKRCTPSIDLELVRSSGRIDVSRHLIEQNAQVLDAAAFTPALMARNERNVTFAAEQCSDAAHGLVRAAGTSGLSESAALQRFWRDVIGMTSHVALRYETAAVRTYPPVLFGE